MPDPRPARGVALMVAAVFCFALLDATSKQLSQTFNVPLLVWSRYFVHCLLMVVLLGPTHRARLVITRRPLPQVARALLLLGVTGFAMAAFRIMPLAETTALLFITPLIVALLAGPMLGERVGAGRWLGAIAGFGGTLLIARPGGALVAEGVVLALLAAACYSLYHIQTRRLTATENPLTMVFYTALVGTITMSLVLPWIWHGPAPSLGETAMIVSLALYGGFGHYLLTLAYHHASASWLAPYLYVQIVWAVLLGWLWHGQWPDLLSMIGMSIIVAAGVGVAIADGRARIGSERG